MIIRRLKKEIEELNNMLKEYDETVIKQQKRIEELEDNLRARDLYIETEAKQKTQKTKRGGKNEE